MDTVPPRTYNNSNFPEGLPAVSLSDEERARQQRWTPLRVTIWILISAIAGLGWWMLAVRRGETVNGIWFVFAAIGSYFIGYRFYAKYIQDKLVHPDDSRATPAEYDYNGRDFVPRIAASSTATTSPPSLVPAPSSARYSQLRWAISQARSGSSSASSWQEPSRITLFSSSR